MVWCCCGLLRLLGQRRRLRRLDLAVVAEVDSDYVLAGLGVEGSGGLGKPLERVQRPVQVGRAHVEEANALDDVDNHQASVVAVRQDPVVGVELEAVDGGGRVVVDPRRQADQLGVKAGGFALRPDAKLEGVRVLVLNLVKVEARIIGVGRRLGRHLVCEDNKTKKQSITITCRLVGDIL